MSVEAKIQELLGRANGAGQLTEESADNLTASGAGDAGAKAAMNAKKDTSKAAAAATAGDSSNPKQGSSSDASFDELDDMEPGKTTAGKMSKDTTLPMKGKGDAKSAKVQSMEETEEDGEAIVEQSIDLSAQLNSIFGEDLSEEFKTKASSIFEAAVIARVNHEMEKVTSKLEEQAVDQLVEFKDTIVEKVDGYLNYVVEQWIEENVLAVDSGLRTEIAEDFITGMKTLFKEHYIEVPEEKYDVIEEMQSTSDEYKAKLDEAISTNIELAQELSSLKREQILDEQTKELAATEVEKLRKLVEGVEFDSEDLFREKVVVIMENYFPKTSSKSPEQVLVEESGTSPVFEDDGSVISKYAQAISRSIKAR